MFYEGRIFRPPSEARSLILQVSVGCSHNACTFCSMYKEKRFRVKSRDEIMALIKQARAEAPWVERVFLADGDALAVETPLLVDILDTLYKEFPNLRRIGAYGGPKDILAKSTGELAQLSKHGLGIIYMGVESGSAHILQDVNKGVSPQEMITAGQKVIAGGIKLSCTVIIGLGGKDLSIEHALETAKVIGQIDPEFLGALTLMVEPGSPLSRLVASGGFKPLTAIEALLETRLLIEHLELSKCVFRSNHASNYLSLKGSLPEDRDLLLETVDNVLRQDRQQYLKPEHWRGL